MSCSCDGVDGRSGGTILREGSVSLLEFPRFVLFDDLLSLLVADEESPDQYSDDCDESNTTDDTSSDGTNVDTGGSARIWILRDRSRDGD
jgi:hypothetical protein